jgi:GntR family transcriptional regulator, transcriptional repressor for pyruvate dehydrogenase complex
MLHNGGRVPVPHEMVRRIQDLIQSGKLKEGDKLPSQRVLSQQFNVSRTSLREALSVLETLGLVRVEPGRGAVVCEPGRKATRWRFGDRFAEADVFQLRMLLEIYTARMAATKMSEEGLQELASNLDAMRGALRDRDLEAAARLDLEFHGLIIHYADNRAFDEVYAGMKNVILEFHRLPLQDHTRLWEPVAEHENIIQALRQRDPDSAGYYMRLHLIRTGGRSGIDEGQCSAW